MEINFQKEKEEMKKENGHLKSQNENLTRSVQQKSEEIENSDSKLIQINFSGSNGVISSLRQNDPNSVELISSSNSDQNPFSGYFSVPQNVLNPDNKIWYSKNLQNSWIQFNFKDKQISPSRYLLRNGNSDGSPQGWKLEGSNNEKDWTTICEVRDCQEFKKKNQEAIFSCSTDQFFSFLRFTQTQENLWKFHHPKDPSSHYFTLNFVEFSGKIISRE
jgi:hypothetical protein